MGTGVGIDRSVHLLGDGGRPSLRTDADQCASSPFSMANRAAAPRVETPTLE